MSEEILTAESLLLLWEPLTHTTVSWLSLLNPNTNFKSNKIPPIMSKQPIVTSEPAYSRCIQSNDASVRRHAARHAVSSENPFLFTSIWNWSMCLVVPVYVCCVRMNLFGFDQFPGLICLLFSTWWISADLSWLTCPLTTVDMHTMACPAYSAYSIHCWPIVSIEPLMQGWICFIWSSELSEHWCWCYVGMIMLCLGDKTLSFSPEKLHLGVKILACRRVVGPIWSGLVWVDGVKPRRVNRYHLCVLIPADTHFVLFFLPDFVYT